MTCVLMYISKWRHALKTNHDARVVYVVFFQVFFFFRKNKTTCNILPNNINLKQKTFYDIKI